MTVAPAIAMADAIPRPPCPESVLAIMASVANHNAPMVPRAIQSFYERVSSYLPIFIDIGLPISVIKLSGEYM